MDNSGFFIAIMVFIGIFYIIISQIIKNKMEQKTIEDQNKWRKNIYNFPGNNR